MRAVLLSVPCLPPRLGVLATAVALVATTNPAMAQSPEVGDTIELRATHHLGVPLHTDPDPPFNSFSRVPDGALSEVLELRESGRWNRIRVGADSREGWIVQRYVGRVVEENGPTADEQEAAVWGSPESCATAVAAGARMHRVLDNPLVVGTWNIRWFPRGCPSQEGCPELATDIDWLACAIAWMGVDVLAVQEFLDTPDARVALGLLMERLNTSTGGAWESDLQDCGSAGRQHVGFIWNSSRVELSNHSDEEQLNGASSGTPCAGNLRPGRYARVASTQDEGVDFHLLSVHLDSGRAQRDFDHRRAAIAEIPDLEIAGQALTELGQPGGDSDILVIGDFNTMGMDPPNPVSEAQELSIFDAELSPAFARASLNSGCSEYFRPFGETTFHAGLLDHIVAAQGMEEIAATARVTGHCAVLDCADFTEEPRAFQVLSDHCPLVVEVRDEDRDGG